MSEARIPKVYVVSDGKGETGSRLVKAALVQFEGQRYEIVRRPNVRSTAEVMRIVEEAAAEEAVIFYTLVGAETRRVIRRTSQELLVPTLDLLGPAFSALHDLFKADPGTTPGLLHDSEREDTARYEAIDYTLKHDDGQRPHELSRADVVLVGVSRASKSTTCFYLACAGVRAANVPLLPDLSAPPELLKLDPSMVVGLRVNVSRLMTMREYRVQSMGMGKLRDYMDRHEISREVTAAHKMMGKYRWQSFDVSYMAIEEVAKQVLKLCGRTGLTLPW